MNILSGFNLYSLDLQTFELWSACGSVFLVKGIKECHSLFYPPEGEKTSTRRKVIKIAKSLAFLGLGAYLLYQARIEQWNRALSYLDTDYELDLALREGPAALHFDPTDPKEKLLILSVGKEVDHNGAFQPLQMGMYSHLSRYFDIKYKVIREKLNICSEIADATQFVNLKKLALFAHGNQDSIGMSSIYATDSMNDITNQDFFTKDCFQGLVGGSIFLRSCSTGAKENGIAYHLAQVAKVPVMAPTNNTVYSSYKLVEPTPSHPFGISIPEGERTFMPVDSSPTSFSWTRLTFPSFDCLHVNFVYYYSCAIVAASVLQYGKHMINQAGKDLAPLRALCSPILQKHVPGSSKILKVVNGIGFVCKGVGKAIDSVAELPTYPELVIKVLEKVTLKFWSIMVPKIRTSV